MKKLEISPGSSIQPSIEWAIGQASNGTTCYFDFNGVTVVVNAESDATLIYRDWDRAMSGYLGKNPTVGPSPSPQLSADEIASDEKIRRENAVAAEVRRIEYEREVAEKAALLKLRLAECPPLHITDQVLWDSFVRNNKEPYGERAIRYAEDWGRLMQARLAAGDRLASCAGPCSDLANDDGISGFQHACAKRLLVACWIFGKKLEALKRI